MTATAATTITGPEWTLVSRAKGGRFYRPVANVPAGLDWDGARELAQRTPREDDVQVWYVPRVSSHAEDRDNVLEDSGRRFPIRWDAAPLVAAPVEPETCEHGVPMDAPCKPCAIAGHEPVDLDDDVEDLAERTVPLAELVDRVLAAHPRVARTLAREEARADHEAAARARLDATRHLADCRGCALLADDGHAYASLIDTPITVAELVELAARPGIDTVHRAGAVEALVHELAELAGRPEPTDADHAEAARLIADPAAFRDGETAEEWAARAYGADA